MKIVIVGAGPSGLFLADRLLDLSPSCTVQLYEGSPSPLDPEADDRRGFGLGLGARIQHWLNSIAGLQGNLAAHGVEFTAGGLILLPRRQLCALLLQSLLRQHHRQSTDEPTIPTPARLSVHFHAPVVEVDLARHEIVVATASGAETIAYDLLVGADGIHSTIRQAILLAHPEIHYVQQQRPQVWKVLPLQPEFQSSPPQIIRLQTRRSHFGLVFGACLPRKQGGSMALIFWQPVGDRDQINPCGIATVEELQQLVQEMTPQNAPPLRLDADQAAAFLAAQPGHEYWSQCRSYHDLAGQAVLIGDAAHGMFSLLGQGCTAAVADAVALSSLIQRYGDQWSVVLPQFSAQQVPEGHAASDLSLLALVVYHRGWGLLYKLVTLLWVVVLRQPSIFARLNQVDATYEQVQRENRFWVRLAKRLLNEMKNELH